MKKYGLLGERLGHSFSPQIHAMLGGYAYELFEVSPDKLHGFMTNADFDGINVTIPYKKAVIPYCTELSDTAWRIGSVNTVIRRADGTLFGDNTDYSGFIAMLKRHGISIGKKAVILGNGGVAPTVREALKTLGACEIITVSRRGENNYANLHRHYDAELIVNTTPVGMFPDNGAALIRPELFPRCKGVVDLIYNPLSTRLVLDARALGLPAYGGLYMLVSQAARSAELFLGGDIPEERIEEVYITLLSSIENLVLIGMPGCGKSSTASALARLTGRQFFDCDDEIVKACGMTIPEFFKKHGKDEFRRLEAEVLSALCRKSGVIIATGGGVVMREQNLGVMRQNGRIVLLDRDISELPTDGRPISQAGTLRALADFRMPLYKSWCDLSVSGSSPTETARKIMEMLKL